MKSIRRPLLSTATAIACAASSAFAQVDPSSQPYLATAPYLAPDKMQHYEFLGSQGAQQTEALSPIVINPQTRANVVQMYNSVYVTTESVPIGWTGTISPCSPGATSVAYRDATLDRVNFFRALAGLPGNVTFNAAWDSTGQQTALIMAANNSLSHSPPTTWTCYTAAGAAGAGESNIALGFGGTSTGAGPKAMKLYMDDFGAPNYFVGHRRWILYPPQANMGSGSVGVSPSANALRVFGSGVAGSRPATPNGVAWPSMGYFPYQLLPWGGPVGENFGRWSYSRNGANFAAATVSVSVNGGAPTSPTVVSRTDNGYGDNTIVWQMNVAPNNPGLDTLYRVTVSGMSGTGIPASVTYDVTVIDPARAGVVRSDFAGTGTSDILWHNSATGMVYELQMNGTTAGSAAVIDTRADLNWKVAAVADINGDGRADVVWQHNTTGVVQGLLMNGTTVTSSGTIYTEPNTNWKIVGAGDFNGDGRADLLWKNAATGEVFVQLLNGLTPSGGGVVYREANPNWVIQQVADFDGNGRADILWRNTSTGDVFVLLMNGTTVAGGGVIYSEPNTNWQIQQAADFNGDGRADILWRNTATGDVFMMLMNGTTISGGSVFYGEPNAAWKIVAAGDYNGDGRADVLWRNTASGQVFMMLMNGFTVSGGGFVYTEPNQDWKILP
jgi:uncharacterized protein YkwD